MSKHTPEPWTFWGDKEAIVMDKPLHSKHGFIAIMACNEDVSARTSSANARRIVACVNACRGLGTDELEQHGLVSAVGYELIELTKQRDELLRNMQDVLDMLINQPHAVTAANQAEDMLRLSIGTAKYFAKAGSENHSPDIAKMVVQDGWKLVPVEPTIEMVSAATRSSVGFGTRAAYQAMLSAAPKLKGGAS